MVCFCLVWVAFCLAEATCLSAGSGHQANSFPGAPAVVPRACFLCFFHNVAAFARAVRLDAWLYCGQVLACSDELGPDVEDMHI